VSWGYSYSRHSPKPVISNSTLVDWWREQGLTHPNCRISSDERASRDVRADESRFAVATAARMKTVMAEKRMMVDIVQNICRLRGRVPFEAGTSDGRYVRFVAWCQ
jgi:hypothetical protein